MKYRIKVQTTDSGEKKYTPQVGVPKLSIGKFDHLWLDWENIIRQDSGGVTASKYIAYNFDTEDEAREMVEKYKSKLIKVKNSEVKTVNYINLD